MSAPNTPKRSTREEMALIEVGHTSISNRTAWAMTWFFLVLIVAMPVAEIGIQVIAALRSGTPILTAVAALPAFSLLRQPPSLGDFTFPIHHAWQIEHNPLHDAEHAIEDASLPRRTVQARLQEVLSAACRTGNSQVVRGVDDWLFYRPGIDYVGGPGFLSVANHHVMPRRDPDPRPAIRSFAKTCADAGIRLLVLPMCDKAMVQPEKLVAGMHAPLDNPDFVELSRELAAEGIDCWSPLQVMLEIAAHDDAYLHQDTHWTPAAMDAVAAALAQHLALPTARQQRTWSTQPCDATRVGDLVDTLKLSHDQAVFAPRTVRIAQVHAMDGSIWQPRHDADVLLLGDSFTNIYSAPQMGWGEGAGFGAHLAVHLGRDIDVIAINGAGASGTRQELAHHPERLLGKKLVIWQFSARDLAVSEWKSVPIVVPPAVSRPQPDAVASSSLELVGTITVVSHVPSPGGLPYADALTTLKIRIDQIIHGTSEQHEALIVVPCMRNFTLLPAAALRVGQRLHVTLVPWSTVESIQGQTKRYDDTDEFDLPQQWVESYEVH